MNRFRAVLALASTTVLGLSSLSTPVVAQCDIGEQDKLTGSAGSQFDNTGASVAVKGGRAAVGARNEDSVASFGGAVYIYELSGSDWLEYDFLQSSDLASFHRFGDSVDLDGDAVIVGAAGAGTGGQAYIFRDASGSYTEEQILLGTGIINSSVFGHSVAIDGDVAVVGARQGNGDAVLSGTVHVFRYDSGSGTWSEEQVLTGGDNLTADNFGNSVDIDGDTIAVGCPDHSDGATDNGAIYVFTHDGSTWSLEQKLTASDAGDGDSLGEAIALDGDRLVGGAPFYDGVNINDGAVYSFRRVGTTWTEDDTFVASDAIPNLNLGQAVALDGETVLSGGVNSSCYVDRFDRQHKLTGSDTQISDNFGGSVAIDNAVAFIGSQADDDLGLDAGAAYVFLVPEILLTVSPSSASAGDPVNIEACGGQTGGLALLYVVDVNGSFVFIRVTGGTFDAAGEFGFGPFPAPPGLTGIITTFQCYGIAASGRPDGSNTASLTFL